MEGVCNVDRDSEVEPDFVHDLTKFPYPFETGSIDLIYMIHIIEHIEEKYFPPLIQELQRILKMNHHVIFTYPEFVQCAQNYIDNKNGNREFWKATLYGRQLTPDDFHVTLMDTRYFKQYLLSLGFKVIREAKEENEDYNTLLVAEKTSEILTRERILCQEIFGEKDE